MTAAASRSVRDRLAVAGAVLWGVSFGALRDFVWADLRDGTIDLRGLPAATRALIWFAAALLAATIGALLIDETWRSQSALVATPRGVTGRGSLVPTTLIPATLVLFAIAWSLILTGALHAGARVRVVVVAVYLVTAASWAEVGTLDGWRSALLAPGVWLRLGALLAVPLLFVVRRQPRRAALDFVMILALVSAVLAPAQAQGLEDWRVTGIPILMARVEGEVTSIRLLVMPLLLLIGIDVASFTRQAAGWTTAVIGARLPRRAPWVLLVPLVGWRVWEIGADALARVEEVSLGSALLAYAGALLGVVSVGLAWWVVSRLASHRAGDGSAVPDAEAAPDAEAVAHAAEERALPLVVAYTAFGLVVFLSGSVANALTAFGLVGAASPFLRLSTVANEVATPWFLLVDVAALAIGVRLAWAGRRAPAIYLTTFAFLRLWWEATRAGRPLASLDPLGWDTVDAWCVVVAVGAAVFWLVRGRLPRERALAVVSILLVTALLRQTDFIENKFSPLFGWAGVGFIAFGLAWDALTKGAWTNRGTPGLPRTARIVLYLGYALLTATVVNWFLVTHDLFSLRFFTGGGALLGLAAFGRPMLYAVIVALLVAPPRTDMQPRPAAAPGVELSSEGV